MNTGDHAIEVRNVSKKFCRSLKRSLWYGMQDLASELFYRNGERDLRKGEFWALKDVSLKLKRGEVLGIIGANGSGKTTLLRIINGLIKPDRGSIVVKGRIGALIALGAGFNPILTGRENIYINAAVLGLGKKKVDKILDEIIDFAEIDEFIDSPIKYYSSGMQVRLGFSVAVHCEPEILLVDEILSVGDAAFRVKSMNKMLEIVNSGKTISFVSHNLQAVEHICKRVVWLNSGIMKMVGETRTVLENYKMFQSERAIERIKKNEGKKSLNYFETGDIWVTRCDLIDEKSKKKTTLGYRDRLVIRIYYNTKVPVRNPYFMVHIIGFDGHCLFQANMLADGGQPDILEGEGWLDIDFDTPPLLPGAHLVQVQIRKDSTTEHYYSRTVMEFKVVTSPEDYGYIGRFKGVYTCHSGIAQPYEYRWGNNRQPSN